MERDDKMLVSELLKYPIFSDFKLLAGMSGLQNEISTVTVIDTPDGAQWLKGGEFVITTGFMLNNRDVSLQKFLKILRQNKIACLGIKRNRHISSIPDSALSLADTIGLPIISIPEPYAFSDIINPVLTYIIDQQHEQLAQASVIHSKFLDLAVNDCSVFEILEALSKILNIPSAFLDIYFKKIYYSDRTSDFAMQIKDENLKEIGEETLSKYDYYPVANQNTVFGYIIFPKGSLKKCQNVSYQVAVEQSAITLILRMHAQISQKLVDERYKSVFVEDLLLNNIKGEDEIYNRALLYNWDFKDGGIVAVVDINNIKRNFKNRLDSIENKMLEDIVRKIFDLAICEMKSMFDNVKYMEQSDLIAFLISVDRTDRQNLKSNLLSVFKNIQKNLLKITDFTIIISVGNYYDNIRDIYKSYSDARTTINLAYALGWFDRILFYEDMALYHMLSPIIDSPTARAYCEKYIRPLEIYDIENGQELVNTLNEIIQTGWNLKKTAENMYLHYNSMKYRYKRISSVLQLDLNNQVNRLMISITMIIHMMNRNTLPKIKRYDEVQ